jgi:hypothetical protein
MESPWVLKEATILRWRFDRDAGFPLLPVALDGFDIATLRDDPRWDPINLPELQLTVEDDVVGALTAAVARRRTQLNPTPMDVLVEDISRRLTTYGPTRLQLVAARLGEAVPTDALDVSQGVAIAIARWMLRQSPPALARVADALAELGNDLKSDDAGGIVNAVAPLWVELDAAAAFVRTGWQQPKRRDLAMACSRPASTVRQYADRAYFPRRTPSVVVVHGLTAGSAKEDVAGELRDELARILPADRDLDTELAELDARIYVVLPLPARTALVTWLQESFPRLTFVFFSPPSQAVPATLPANVLRVRPELAAAIEDAAANDYRKALQMLGVSG